jgi:anti-sigma regulatory factor (Ser/Thr protein kinase)
LARDTLQLKIPLPLHTAALPPLRGRVRTFLSAHVSDDDLHDILLCLQEAMKNAVRFSGSRKAVEVRVRVLDHRVSVVVRDYGVGIGASAMRTMESHGRPDALSDRGRGLYLMAQLMDELELISEKGIEVRMVKRVR